ncbi:MAG: hypothetical protein JSV93_06395 [Candidatus Omnitrophota bacterium]|nr:MAG: hypothetical protein JSV93_06395 [Candidatus Omnitrophota bacterium]
MSGNKAIILLNVVIILLTIALIGASLVAFLSLTSFSAQTTADRTKAFYLAEAGIAHAINILRNRARLENDTIGPVSLGEGTYEVKIDFGQSVIVSTGRVGNSKKTLQLQYSTL